MIRAALLASLVILSTVPAQAQSYRSYDRSGRYQERIEEDFQGNYRRYGRDGTYRGRIERDFQGNLNSYRRDGTRDWSARPWESGRGRK